MEITKNRLMDLIFTTSNKEILTAIEGIFQATSSEEKIELDRDLKEEDAKWMEAAGSGL